MTKNKLRIAEACAAAAAAAVLAVLCAVQTGGSPRVIGSQPPAGDTAEAFFEAYRDGDGERLDGLVYDCSGVGLSEPEDSVSAILFNYAQDSLEAELGEVRYTDSVHAEQDVKVRYLYIPGTMKELHGLIEEELFEQMKKTDGDMNVGSEDEEYYNEVVVPAMENAAEEFIGSGAGKYFREDELTVEMVYDGREWKLVMTDALKKALLAGMS